jgi:hypothetical protein
VVSYVIWALCGRRGLAHFLTVAVGFTVGRIKYCGFSLGVVNLEI